MKTMKKTAPKTSARPLGSHGAQKARGMRPLGNNQQVRTASQDNLHFQRRVADFVKLGDIGDVDGHLGGATMVGESNDHLGVNDGNEGATHRIQILDTLVRVFQAIGTHQMSVSFAARVLGVQPKEIREAVGTRKVLGSAPLQSPVTLSIERRHITSPALIHLSF